MARIVELGKPVYKLVWGNFPKDATGSVVNLDGDVTISGVGFRHVGRAVEFILPPSFIVADNLPASIVYKVNSTVVAAEQLALASSGGGSVDLSDIEDRLTALEEAPAPEAPAVYALDRTNLNATYGDPFTSWNASKWTLHGGLAVPTITGSWANFTTGGVAGTGATQTAPGGNWTAYAKFSMASGGSTMFGLLAVDAGNDGAAAGLYNNAPNGPIIGNLNDWIYNSSFQSTTHPAGTIGMSGIVWWVKMEKNGTAYRTASSLNGQTWGPWTPTITQGNTITKVGFGQWFGSGASPFSIDFFDLVPA